MKYIKAAQKCFVYIFFFSLNFETMDLLNLGVDYLASKISIVLLIVFSLLRFKSLFTLKYFNTYLKILAVYFTLLTIISFLNINSYSQIFFDFPFFLNIIIFLVLCNYSRLYENILLKGLFVIAISTFILWLLFIIGVGVSFDEDGRSTIFNINENYLGLIDVISLFILSSLIFENKLNLGQNRFFLFLLFPGLLISMLGTGSRVSLISVFIGIIIFIYYNKSITKKRKTIISILAFFIFSLIWILYLKNSAIGLRLTSSIQEGDISNRDLIWVTIFDIISNNFIIGIGKTGYAQRIADVFGGLTSPHNVLIEVVCYTGIIGLIIFLIFFFKVGRNAINTNKYEKEILPLLLLIPIVGLLLSGQIFEVKVVWVLFAYMASKFPVKGELAETIN